MTREGRGNRNYKRVVQLAIGCLISGVMLYLVFKDLDTETLKRNLSVMRWWPLVPFVALFMLHYVLRSWRWRFLLPTPLGERPSLRKLFDALIIGNVASFVLPFRLGEFVRPFVLSRWTDYRFASSFVSVVIERFFDLSAVLISFAVIAPRLPDFPGWAIAGVYSLGGIAACLLLFLICGALLPSLLREVISFCVRPLPASIGAPLESFLFDLLDGAAVIRTPRRVASILGLTGAVWLSTFLQFHVMLYLFPYHQSMLFSVTLAVFVSLAVAIPSAPGFIGVFQAGCVAAGALFSYPQEAIVVYSLAIHVVSYLLFIVLGFWLLTVHDLSLFELKRAVEGDGDTTGKTS
jgi:uncharacterized protein (TIRG00374 family)